MVQSEGITLDDYLLSVEFFFYEIHKTAAGDIFG